VKKIIKTIVIVTLVRDNLLSKLSSLVRMQLVYDSYHGHLLVYISCTLTLFTINENHFIHLLYS
jgi:hypothetical protein